MSTPPSIGSPYGFGCAGIMRVPVEADRQKLLACTYDSGVRHFDVARMYGLGEAEGVLGRFLQGKRAEVTITSKFGIEISAQTARLAGVQSIARRVLNAAPWLRGLVRRNSGGMYNHDGYTPEKTQASVETSLRELQTDYIDFLFLHDNPIEACHSDDLLALLDKLVAQGKIRAFGLATHVPVEQEAVAKYPRYAGVLQCESNVLKPAVRLLGGPDRLMITHSHLRQPMEVLGEYVKRQPTEVADWSQKLGTDLKDKRAVATLLLGWGIRENPNGGVLFSSNSEENIRFNITRLQEAIADKPAANGDNGATAARQKTIEEFFAVAAKAVPTR